jgi:hypothetical protein
MKTPNCRSLLFPLLSLSIAAGSAAAADSSGLDRLQGVWSANRTNQEGQVLSQVLEINNDRLTFKVVGADSEIRLFAKGAVTVQKLGPFQTLKITGIQAGRSEDATEAIDDERTSVFVLEGDALTLASNFDKTRAGQPPRAETYSRSKAAPKQPENTAAKLAGTWKMDVRFGETDSDYELRLAQTEGKLSGTLISPRSGEHKFRQVTWADEKLAMELDREFNGNTVTLVYTGKLGADGLSGTVAAKGAEDQFSGTWKARK